MEQFSEIKKDNNIAIETNNLSKTYKTEGGQTLHVFENVNLQIKDGEFISIIGPSGCGKTTLLEILAGLRERSSGKIIVYGQEEYEPNSKKGVVFQKDAVFPWYTVGKNVEYGLTLKGWNAEDKKKQGERFLKMVNLNNYRNYFPKELSGGMKKRLAIAMVFANDPKVLFMDEPFGSLDYTTKIELQDELLKLWKDSKKTIVFVTHDLEEALYLSDRIFILKEKTIKYTYSVTLERPRNQNMRLEENFRKELLKLWEFIQ